MPINEKGKKEKRKNRTCKNYSVDGEAQKPTSSKKWLYDIEQNLINLAEFQF